MEKFRGVDYYGIETLLSEDERMIRDAVRDWVEAEFIPIVPEHHRAGTFPIALIPKLGELGVFGATLKGYGCAGLSNVAYGLIMQELERGDSGLRSCASVQSGLVMYPIYAYGSDAQKDRWLPVLASGETVGCDGSNGHFGSAAAGSGKTVTGDVALNGADKANYQLTSASASTTATINKRNVTAAITAADKTYDGTKAATINSCGLEAASGYHGVISGDHVGCDASNGQFGTSAAGDNKNVSADVALNVWY